MFERDQKKISNNSTSQKLNTKNLVVFQMYPFNKLDTRLISSQKYLLLLITIVTLLKSYNKDSDELRVYESPSNSISVLPSPLKLA